MERNHLTSTKEANEVIIGYLEECNQNYGWGYECVRMDKSVASYSIDAGKIFITIWFSAETQKYEFEMLTGNGVKSFDNFEDFKRMFENYMWINTTLIPISSLIAEDFASRLGMECAFERIIGNEERGYHAKFNIEGEGNIFLVQQDEDSNFTIGYHSVDGNKVGSSLESMQYGYDMNNDTVFSLEEGSLEDNSGGGYEETALSGVETQEVMESVDDTNNDDLFDDSGETESYEETGDIEYEEPEVEEITETDEDTEGDDSEYVDDTESDDIFEETVDTESLEETESEDAEYETEDSGEYYDESTEESVSDESTEEPIDEPFDAMNPPIEPDDTGVEESIDDESSEVDEYETRDSDEYYEEIEEPVSDESFEESIDEPEQVVDEPEQVAEKPKRSISTKRKPPAQPKSGVAPKKPPIKKPIPAPRATEEPIEEPAVEESVEELKVPKWKETLDKLYADAQNKGYKGVGFTGSGSLLIKLSDRGVKLKISGGKALDNTLTLEKGVSGLYRIKGRHEFETTANSVDGIVNELLSNKSIWEIENVVLSDIIALYKGSLDGNTLVIDSTTYDILVEDGVLFINNETIASTDAFYDMFLALDENSVEEKSADDMGSVSKETDGVSDASDEETTRKEIEALAGVDTDSLESVDSGDSNVQAESSQETSKEDVAMASGDVVTRKSLGDKSFKTEKISVKLFINKDDKEYIRFITDNHIINVEPEDAEVFGLSTKRIIGTSRFMIKNGMVADEDEINLHTFAQTTRNPEVIASLIRRLFE